MKLLQHHQVLVKGPGVEDLVVLAPAAEVVEVQLLAPAAEVVEEAVPNVFYHKLTNLLHTNLKTICL